MVISSGLLGNEKIACQLTLFQLTVDLSNCPVIRSHNPMDIISDSCGIAVHETINIMIFVS